MFFYTIKAICISLLLIALIHYLYSFFKDTLTVPKIKDLVNKPAKRYDEMFDILSNSKRQGILERNEPMQGQPMQGQHMQSQHMQSQPTQDQSMQEELKNFLNELKKPNEIKFNNNNNNMDFSTVNDMSIGQYTPF
jgi:hypothetical protein